MMYYHCMKYLKEMRMRNTFTIYLSTLFFSMMSFFSNAYATDCYSSSPNLENQKDAYYNLDDVEPLSNQEQNEISGFLKKITGKYKGNITFIDCIGSDSAPETLTRKAKVVVENYQSNNGTLTFNAKINDTKNRIKSADSFTLFGDVPVFDYQLIDENHIVFSEKFRRTNKNKNLVKSSPISNTNSIINKASTDITDKTFNIQPTTIKNRSSRLTETIFDLLLVNGGFTLTKSFYINGVFAGEERWQLN